MNWQQATGLIGLLLLAACGDSAGQERVLYSRFQSGEVAVFDDGGKRLGSIPVEDGAGQIGLAASLRRGEVYVVDGDEKHRLRVFDLNSLRQKSEHPLLYRALRYSGPPVVYLTADAASLLIDTFDPSAAASGVRIFDIEAKRFEAAGLRDRPCGNPLFASAPGGIVGMACTGAVAFASGRPLGSTGPLRAAVIEDPFGVDLRADGTSMFVLQRSLMLHEISRSGGVSSSLDLRKSLGLTPAQAPLSFDVDDNGVKVAVVSGGKAWILPLRPPGSPAALPMPGACEGIQFAATGADIYTVCRAEGRMLFLHSRPGAGEVSRFTLDSNAGASPAIWRVVRR